MGLGLGDFARNKTCSGFDRFGPPRRNFGRRDFEREKNDETKEEEEDSPEDSPVSVERATGGTPFGTSMNKQQRQQQQANGPDVALASDDTLSSDELLQMIMNAPSQDDGKHQGQEQHPLDNEQSPIPTKSKFKQLMEGSRTWIPRRRRSRYTSTFTSNGQYKLYITNQLRMSLVGDYIHLHVAS